MCFLSLFFKVSFDGKSPQKLYPGDWPFTRYGNHQYCMVYGIQKRGRWGGACIAQWACNRIAIGKALQVVWDNKRSIDSHSKALK